MHPRADGIVAVYQSAQLCLWVEDPETKAYLDALWSDGRIRTLVGGGADAVANLARAAWQDGLKHVFALRDRDFGTPSMPPASGPVFVVPRHEVENYLLDANAIAACVYNTRRATAADIGAYAATTAQSLAVWMASRRVLRDVWSATTGGFPADPRPTDVPSQASAQAWLTAKTSTIGLTTAQVQVTVQALPGHIATYTAQVSSGAWRDEFSGKEILAPLVQWVWHAQHKNPGGTMARTMVAGAIGERQRVHSTVPVELAALRVHLLAQAGLTP